MIKRLSPVGAVLHQLDQLNFADIDEPGGIVIKEGVEFEYCTGAGKMFCPESNVRVGLLLNVHAFDPVLVIRIDPASAPPAPCHEALPSMVLAEQLDPEFSCAKIDGCAGMVGEVCLGEVK